LRERLCNVGGKPRRIMGSPGATIAAVASPEGVLEDLTGCLQGWKRKVCSTEFLSLSLSLLNPLPTTLHTNFSRSLLFLFLDNCTRSLSVQGKCK
jgi:hypothetical protein